MRDCTVELQSSGVYVTANGVQFIEVSQMNLRGSTIFIGRDFVPPY